VFPIVGGRKVEHLHANIEALEISLSREQIAYLESVKPFDKGFPHNRFVCRHFESKTSKITDFGIQGDGTDYNKLYNSAGTFDKWPVAEPIRPTK
jgi:hypothetical protein